MKQSVKPESTRPLKLPITKSKYSKRVRDFVYTSATASRYRRLLLVVLRQPAPQAIREPPTYFLIVRMSLVIYQLR